MRRQGGRNQRQVARKKWDTVSVLIAGGVLQRPRETWEGSRGPPVPSIKEIVFRGLDKRVHFTELPEGTLLVGNCTAPHCGKGIFVPGCPPVGSQILAAISGKPSTDDKEDRNVDKG